MLNNKFRGLKKVKRIKFDNFINLIYNIYIKDKKLKNYFPFERHGKMDLSNLCLSTLSIVYSLFIIFILSSSPSYCRVEERFPCEVHTLKTRVRTPPLHPEALTRICALNYHRQLVFIAANLICG